MNRRSHMSTPRSLLLAVAVIASMTSTLSAQDSSARVIYQVGRVSLADNGYFKALSVGDAVKVKQTIITGADGYARFEVSDGSTFEVFPNSQVVFRDIPGSWENLLNVFLGRVKVFIQHAPGKPNPNKVTSPTAVISVRGTVFDVVVDPNDESTFVTVDEGEVAVSNRTAPGNPAVLKPGDSITVYRGVPLMAKQVDKGSILRRVLYVARDAYYQVMIQGPRGGGPIGGTTTGGAQGDKGKDTGTPAPGTPPAPPGTPPPPPGQ